MKKHRFKLFHFQYVIVVINKFVETRNKKKVSMDILTCGNIMAKYHVACFHFYVIVNMNTTISHNPISK